jgi:hypothetical protein
MFLFEGLKATRSWANMMWQKLSLRARINLLLALVLTLGAGLIVME